jgi:LacI family transcriptional regulator
MKKRPTLADVARTAGVSTMTVSRAINNKPGLSDELRQKILKIAGEIGFQPNQVARGLVTRQTFTVGLVVPDITIPFYAYIARGVEDICYEYGYHVFLVNTADDLERERTALNLLQQRDIDGAILCSSRVSPDELAAVLQRIPAAILINRDLKDPLPNVVTINVNDQRGAQIAVQHLIEQGRTRIAYLGGPANSVSNQRRLEGYRQALKNAGQGFDPVAVESAWGTSGVKAALQQLLERCPGLDAIFAYSDLVAVDAMQELLTMGKAVPGDVAMIGADDVPLASMVRPRLSTLRVNLPHIGRLAMRTLLEMIEGEAAAGSYQIEPELILRESG